MWEDMGQILQESRESCLREGSVIYKGVVWGIFASLLANCLVLAPWLVRLSTLPEGHTDPQPRWTSAQGCLGWGRVARLIMAWAFLPLDTEEPFCTWVISPLPQEGGNVWSLDLFFKQRLAPLCSCHDCYGKVSAGDKAWQFAPFLLLLLFWGADKGWLELTHPGSGTTNRRLLVSVRPEVYLFSISQEM